jgi:hypothetical protein
MQDTLPSERTWGTNHVARLDLVGEHQWRTIRRLATVKGVVDYLLSWASRSIARGQVQVNEVSAKANRLTKFRSSPLMNWRG